MKMNERQIIKLSNMLASSTLVRENCTLMLTDKNSFGFEDFRFSYISEDGNVDIDIRHFRQTNDGEWQTATFLVESQLPDAARAFAELEKLLTESGVLDGDNQ